MIPSVYVLVCMLSCFICCCFAKSYSVSDISNPMKGPEEAELCGRPNVQKSAICDPDNLMTQESKDVVEGIINQVSNAEIGVVVVGAMSFSSRFGTLGVPNAQNAAKAFATSIHDMWGVGDAKTNNGVLVFLSIEDRVWYVSVGKGATIRLSSAVIDQVMGHATQHLKGNKIGLAVETIVQEFAVLFERPPQKVTVSQLILSSFHAFPRAWIFFAAVLFVVLHDLCRTDTAKMAKGKQALDKLLTDVRHMQSGRENKFHSDSCPICLEDFPFTTDDSINGNDVENGKKVLPGKVVSLQCGHIFCRECIVGHINGGGDKCPICREKIDAGHMHSASQVAASRSRLGGCCVSLGRLGSTCLDCLWLSRYPRHSNHLLLYPELYFRLHRMRYLYPDVLPQDQFNSLSSAAATGSWEQFVRTGDARLSVVSTRLVELRKAYASSGSSGSSRSGSSFGGGRSFGGRGGGW